MAFRRFNSFSRTRGNFGSRFRRAPGKLIWTCASAPFTFTTAAGSNAVLLQPSQWVTNTAAGGFEHAKVLKMVLLFAQPLTATFPASGIVQSPVAFTIDDATATLSSPGGVSYYSDTQPFRVVTWTFNALTANLPYVSNALQNPSGSYSLKVNRRIRSDQNVFLSVPPAGLAGVNVTFPLLARFLLRLNA